jgi:hypothetical protein
VLEWEKGWRRKGGRWMIGSEIRKIFQIQQATEEHW